jgi:hypothetical protein
MRLEQQPDNTHGISRSIAAIKASILPSFHPSNLPIFHFHPMPELMPQESMM